MSNKNKTDWKLKLMLSILIGMISVIVLLFGITYGYFVKKLSANNERIVNMSFKETEKNLKEMIENSELELNHLINNPLMWEFSEYNFPDVLKRSINTKNIIREFDEILSKNSDYYGVAALCGDERTVVSTSEKKSRSGQTYITEELRQMMKECKHTYPYVVWVSSEDLKIPDHSPLQMIINRPVLLGMKAMEENDTVEKDSYLIIAIDENEVQKSYEPVVYNHSKAVLTDRENKIISATDKKMIGTGFNPDDASQNIEYQLSYMGWKLVNMIPKESYLKDAHDLRNFGLVIIVLASIGVLIVAIIWSKKYSTPIEWLMIQMEQVRNGQLNIEKPAAKGWPELDRLNDEFYYTIDKLKKYIEKLKVVEQEKAKEELLALQYQINPHFLYNSLNSIRWMAMMTNNTKVADSLVVLTKIIMPIMKDPSFTWKLSEELEFIENYMVMMQLRYGDTMDYQLDCSKGLYHEMFPRFILQPVIENCFVHGSSPDNILHIHVSVRKTEMFYICVFNRGASMSKERVDKVNQMLGNSQNSTENIGLSNISKRLRLLYGYSDVWIESDVEGVRVNIRF